jgi:hypothetical protein
MIMTTIIERGIDFEMGDKANISVPENMEIKLPDGRTLLIREWNATAYTCDMPFLVMKASIITPKTSSKPMTPPKLQQTLDINRETPDEAPPAAKPPSYEEIYRDKDGIIIGTKWVTASGEVIIHGLVPPE